MLQHQTDGLVYYTFASLDAFPELIHGITTRHGGISTGLFATLNLTKATGDDPAAVEHNLQRVCAALGVRRDYLVSPNQRHTANVRRVDQADRGRVLPGFDVLITDQVEVPLLLRYADCAPVLIYDPVRRALALVHSGWRGTVLGASRAAVRELVHEYGSKPADMICAIGPSIGPCCYEVGPEVVSAVEAAFGDSTNLLPLGRGGRHHLDLWAANRRWLKDEGVGLVEVSGVCTACQVSDFYSYRADHGRTGHFGALLALRHDGHESA